MGLGLDSTASSGDGFEDLGVDDIMTHATGRWEDDLNPGQQDDYFDEDLAASDRPTQPNRESEAASWS